MANVEIYNAELDRTVSVPETAVKHYASVGWTLASEKDAPVVEKPAATEVLRKPRAAAVEVVEQP